MKSHVTSGCRHSASHLHLCNEFRSLQRSDARFSRKKTSKLLRKRLSQSRAQGDGSWNREQARNQPGTTKDTNLDSCTLRERNARWKPRTQPQSAHSRSHIVAKCDGHHALGQQNDCDFYPQLRLVNVPHFQASKMSFSTALSNYRASANQASLILRMVGA